MCVWTGVSPVRENRFASSHDSSIPISLNHSSPYIPAIWGYISLLYYIAYRFNVPEVSFCFVSLFLLLFGFFYPDGGSGNGLQLKYRPTQCITMGKMLSIPFILSLSRFLLHIYYFVFYVSILFFAFCRTITRSHVQ